MSGPAVVERLRRHELFNQVDEEQLSWLVERGQLRTLAPGELLFGDGQPATMFVVLLEGELLISKVIDGRREVLTRHVARPDRGGAAPAEAGRAADNRVDGKPVAAHGFTGEMPLLAGESYVADATAVGPTTVITYDQEAFLTILARMPQVNRVLLPVLAWRIQSSEALARQRNTLQALGTLAAGLAHELNNPAAAVVRNSRTLRQTLRRVAETEWPADAGVAAAVGGWLASVPAGVRLPGSLDREAAEDALAAWLAEHGLPPAARRAGELADLAVGPEALDRLADLVGADQLRPAVDYATSMLTAYSLVQEIADAGERVASIIRSVRDYANLDRAPLQDVDLVRGIDATLAMLKAKMDGIRVIRDYPPQLPVLHGYPGELNQVWTNLIDNALDAMRGDGELRLSVWPDRDWVVVEIGDTGAGVPAQDQDRIFEPFFTTKDVGKGTGLGLHLSHRIVTQRHGGTLQVTSRPGDTRFTVRLPVARQDAGPPRP